MSILDEIIRDAKAEGTYDTGVLEIKSFTDATPRVIYSNSGGNQVEYWEVKVDRGMSWDDSRAIYEEAKLALADRTDSSSDAGAPIVQYLKSKANSNSILLVAETSPNPTV